MNDVELLTTLGLNGATEIEKAKHIIKRSVYTDLASNEKRLCIYFRPSRKALNPLYSEEVLQIDCHVPALQDYLAYRAQKRIRELLHEYDPSGRIFYFDGQLGELPSMPGFVCVGSRYIYYTVI